MDAATVIVGVAGLVTTLLAPLLTSAVSHRQARAAWFRELRVQLYIDVGEFLEATASAMDELTIPVDTGRRSNPELVHSDQLTARVNLLTSRSLQEAWAGLLKAHTALGWEFQENPDIGYSDHPYLEETSRYIVECRNAIERMRAELRHAIENPDSK